eukprot:11140739-Lingulodinium_polyedra.AAC.1
MCRGGYAGVAMAKWHHRLLPSPIPFTRTIAWRVGSAFCRGLASPSHSCVELCRLWAAPLSRE